MIIGIDASRANVGEKTGTELYSFEVIRRMVPQFNGHTVRLYSREPLEPVLRNLGPGVEERVLRWPPGILWSHLRLSWELLRHRPDVLFVPADTVPLVHPRRTVTTIHDLGFERFPQLYRRTSVQRRLGWLRPLVHFGVRLFTLGRYSASEVDYHRWSVRHAIRAASHLLTISEFSRREIHDLFGVPISRISVTYLGVTPADTYDAIEQRAIDEILQHWRLTKPFFLFIGRLELKKNIKHVLIAYRSYRQQVKDPIDLVLLGPPGNGWAECAPLVNGPDVAGSIHQLGWQPEAIRMVLQRAATALVFASRYEGFGIPAAESLSAGVPVVASRAGSLPEVLGPCAIYVNADDPADIARGLVAVSTDEKQRGELRQSGRERVRRFTWDRTATLTRQAIEAALAGQVEKW